MSDWQAPAKLNLDLRLDGPDPNGMHPLRSVVQTIDWCDTLAVAEGDEDHLVVEGADLDTGRSNLVWRAVDALAWESRPALDLKLTKRVAAAAGLGGGSSDAAALLAALGELGGFPRSRLQTAATGVGSDVAYFLTGGTALMEGYGSEVTPLEPLAGFAVAVVVPPFELSTPEVYRRWDELEGPRGAAVDERFLPPGVRGLLDGGNDLTPAAVSLRPDLGDWLADLAGRWGRPVVMSGSGPSCFAYFLDLDEARGAADDVQGARASVAAQLRGEGVARLQDGET